MSIKQIETTSCYWFKYKGFTLLEILIVLSIIGMVMLFSLPTWQKTDAQIILNKEQQKLYVFLRQIQARVENSNDIWFLLASRNISKQQWCLTAQPKREQLCDCLNPQSCSQQQNIYFYYPYFPQQTMLNAKSYYPKELSRFNGTRNTFSTVCFVLQAGQSRTLFSLFNVGSLKIKDYQSMSACVDEGEGND